MEITEIRVFLKEGQDKKLKAYVAVTFDSMFAEYGHFVSLGVDGCEGLPGGVIGNTAEFGSAFPGSSPGWAALRLGPSASLSASSQGGVISGRVEP